MVSPSAARPAITSDTDARRSVAMTGAPRSFAVPSMVAVSPLSEIRAPNRASSCTCMKRFSKIVSVIWEAPPAQATGAIGDFGFAGGVVDNSRTFRERRGHQRDMGAAHRDLWEIDGGAAQAAGRFCDHIAGVDGEVRAEFFQRHD